MIAAPQAVSPSAAAARKLSGTPGGGTTAGTPGGRPGQAPDPAPGRGGTGGLAGFRGGAVIVPSPLPGARPQRARISLPAPLILHPVGILNKNGLAGQTRPRPH